MSPKAPKKGSKVMSAPRRAQKPMSREARAMYAELQRGVRHLEGSVGEIQRGLRNAERKLEADARAQIRELRKDARTHLSVLKSKVSYWTLFRPKYCASAEQTLAASNAIASSVRIRD